MGAVTARPRLATVWLGGCSGCHMSFLDQDERLLDLAARADLVYSPIADVKEFPEADIALVEGSIANTDHLHHIHLIRERTRLLVAFGDCAVTGNVTAMRNSYPVAEVLETSYKTNATLVRGVPEGNPVVPALLERVMPIHEVVKVDYHLQGCPPDADSIYEVITALLDGREPQLTPRRFGQCRNES